MAFVPAFKPPLEISEQAHWFLVRDGACVVMTDTAQGARLPRREELAALGVDPAAAHYLGRCANEDCFVVELPSSVELPSFAELPRYAVTAPWSLCGLRQLYGQLPEEVFGVAGRAVQVAAFHRDHRYCGRCGAPTTADTEERSVHCRPCELKFYPRIAPAIIVLVRRDERALLARSSRFASGFYSTLAGFVEPGESLEQTLEREVFEEVGVRVRDLRYFGSQPWPFPHSLMVAFVAQYAAGELAVDGSEIVDASWFSPDALPQVPPRPSIARRLIDAWLDEVKGPAAS